MNNSAICAGSVEARNAVAKDAAETADADLKVSSVNLLAKIDKGCTQGTINVW